MGVPALEKPPGICQPWYGIWQETLRQLKEQGSWTLALRPLLDEYVLALEAAERARESAESAVAWDKHSKRALVLADALGLTPKSRKARPKDGEEEQGGDFDALDELAPRRKARSNGA